MSEPSIGHNSESATRIAKDRLRSLVERIERIQEEIDASRSDQKGIYSEAKGNGYDVKTLRKVIAIRKKDPAARAEEEALLETYMSALGE